MLINSPSFLLGFLPISLIFVLLFASGEKRKTIRIYTLTAASIVFYGLFGLEFVVLLLVAITVNFALARYMNIYSSAARHIMSLGVVLNLLLLAYYKYSNYFIDNLNYFFNVNSYVEKAVIPIGLSFIVFQQISYLVDEYRHKNLKHSFVEYCLFITFFPKIIAGPIVRANEFFYQIRRKRFRQLTSLNLTVGAAFLTLGVFKKVVLGDRFAFYADRVFSADIDILSATDLWLGMFAYSMQIYFDFSGYSDMAIGVARMFGIKLPYNFNSPYKAISIIDFWRRWHLTLSHFLRDYLYIPLGGNRFGLKRQFVSVMLTMTLGGLWHGAANTFLVWGVLHGAMLIVAILWNKYGSPLSYWFSVLLTFVCVSLAWVFFRATEMDQALNFIYGLFDLSRGLGLSQFPLEAFYHWGSLFGVGFIIVFIMPNSQSISLSVYRYKFILAPLLAVGFVGSLLFISKVQPFIYNAF
jgi:D-alanyl-lipoteichoic acid acyltransferase DltB (MBOAT superfamily)